MPKTLEEKLLAAGESVEENEPETSTLGAVALGGLQGLSFGFADELEAAAKSALGDMSYQEAVEQAREKYKLAEKERPGAYTAAEIGTGVGSMFIPGLGAASGAKVATAAGKGIRSLIQAKRGAELTTKGARAAEAIGTGVVGGGIGAIGTSEADVLSKKSPEAAAQLAADIGTGAAIGGAFGGVASKIADSERVQKAAKAISESKIGKAAKGLRDRILSGGEESLEEGQKFINQPEKVKEVENILKKGVNKKIHKLEDELTNLKRAKGAEDDVISKEKEIFDLEKDRLSKEISDIRRKEDISITSEEQAVRSQTSGLKKEVRDVKDALTMLAPKIDEAQQTIKNRVQDLSKKLDKQSADSVKNLYDNQLRQVDDLSKQRDIFVEQTLSDIRASTDDAQQLQDAVLDMYSLYKDDYETAIKPVFVKIMRDEPRFMQMMQIVEDPSNLPQLKDAILQNQFSKADVVKMVENAKKNLWTSDVSTPFGAARKNAYQILNDKVTEISPEYKQFNTEINKLLVTRDFLENSPLIKMRMAPKVGEKGGEFLAPKAYAAAKRPDIKGLETSYINDLADKGVDVGLLARQEKALQQQLTTEQLLPLQNLKKELVIRGKSLRNQIAEIEDKIRLSSGEERLKLKRMLDEKTDQLNLYTDKMTEKLSKARQDLADKYDVNIQSAEDVLKETRRQTQEDVNAYKLLQEQPLSAEEAGQLATIGLTTGTVPFKSGRFLRPSPMTRIKVYNAIASRFQNPALTAAIAPRIGQGFTRQDIMNLANTHNVNANTLEQQLMEAGELVVE